MLASTILLLDNKVLYAQSILTVSKLSLLQMEYQYGPYQLIFLGDDILESTFFKSKQACKIVATDVNKSHRRCHIDFTKSYVD